MTRNRLFNLVLVLAILVSALPAFNAIGAAGPGDTIKQAAFDTHTVIKGQMVQESQTWGVPIMSESVMYASQDGTVSVNARTTKNQGPLDTGADVGFVYLSSTATNNTIPEGFYAVNVKGDLNGTTGEATLIDKNHLAVATAQATFRPVSYMWPWPGWWWRARSLHIIFWPNGWVTVRWDYLWYWNGRWYEIIVHPINPYPFPWPCPW